MFFDETTLSIKSAKFAGGLREIGQSQDLAKKQFVHFWFASVGFRFARELIWNRQGISAIAGQAKAIKENKKILF